MLTRVMPHADILSEHPGGYFRPQFFLGVVRCAKAAAEVSIEAGLVAGPVTELMERRIVVVGGVGELSALRERDRVC